MVGSVRLARSCTHGTKLKEIKNRKFKRNTVFIFKVYTVYVIANLNLKGFSFFYTHCSQLNGSRSEVDV